MIPEHWEAVRRPQDGEVVGYLVPTGSDVVPTTLAGTPLGGRQPAPAARALLVARGLRAMDGRWWCRLPEPLPCGVLDGSSPAPGWDWCPVVVVEAAPDGVVVRPEWPAPGEAGARAVLPVPVGDLLRLEPPG
jgi:hypothetical protein